MPAAIHRTAVFHLPEPTQRIRTALEKGFAAYGDAYAELLYSAYLRYGRADDLAAGRTAGLDALRGLATFGLDERTNTPRMSARTLTQHLYAGDALPPRAVAALERLPSRLRQSAREHAGQSLMSYVALADEWLALPAEKRRGRLGGPPGFPQQPRTHGGTGGGGGSQRSQQRTQAAILADLAALADDPRRERALVAELQSASRADRQRSIAIPFVGVSDDYGCGLYYRADTDAFYARLDVQAPGTRAARPLDMPGVYTSVKTGERWASAREAARQTVDGLRSFGRRTGMLWVPLLLDASTRPGRASYHERALRFSTVAYLPQRGQDATRPAPAEPVSAKLVRRLRPRDGVLVARYELHVSFELPSALAEEESSAGESAEARRRARDARPILAINRGLRHLYAATLLSADARTELAAFAADGRVLLMRQEALERVRRLHAQRGRGQARWTVRDRRQARVADGEIAVCANQIVEVARRAGAQVVMEDMASFARGAAVRAVSASPRARQTALRTLLGKRQFESLRHAVDARLELVGLPSVATVSAAWISRTCVACGARDTRTYGERMRAGAENNGATQPETTPPPGPTTPPAPVAPPWEFVCPACGARRDVDEAAAINVGRKLAWLRSRRAGSANAAGASGDAAASWEQFVRGLVASG